MGKLIPSINHNNERANISVTPLKLYPTFSIRQTKNIHGMPFFLDVNPIPPGLFEGGSAFFLGGGRGEGGGKCPRPITLKLLMIIK